MTGRNDQCPCGSGKKYKKCHLLGEDSDRTDPLSKANRPPGVSKWHDRDELLVKRMMDYRARRFRDEPVVLPLPPTSLMSQILAPWIVYVGPTRGKTLVDWFLEEKGHSLPRDERAYLQAQQRAWVSVWKIENRDPAGGLADFADLLTGQRRTVHDVSLARNAQTGRCALARVVDVPDESIVSGSHPLLLRSEVADAVIEAFLEVTELTRPVAPDALCGENAEELLDLWHEKYDRPYDE